MPIKWSALKVSEAMDMVDRFLNEAAEPMESAVIVTREALRLPKLPDYMHQRLMRLGATLNSAVPTCRREARAVRNDIPAGAIDAERERMKQGSQAEIKL